MANFSKNMFEWIGLLVGFSIFLLNETLKNKIIGLIITLFVLLIFIYKIHSENKQIKKENTDLINYNKQLEDNKDGLIEQIKMNEKENKELINYNKKLEDDNKQLKDNRDGLIEQIEMNEKENKELKNDLDKLYITTESYRITYQKTINDVSSAIEDKIIRLLNLIKN